MAIDASALTSIHNAISNSTLNTNGSNNKTNYVDVISKASGQAMTETRYKAAFEEKMKLANNSEDVVDISEESINALKNYVNNEKAQTQKSSTNYTYDYLTIKQKRLENQAAIEKEYAQKYGNENSSQISPASDNANTANVQNNTANSIVQNTSAQSQNSSEEEQNTTERPVVNGSTATEDVTDSQTVNGADEMSESATLSE